MVDKDTVIYIIVTICVWSIIAALAYFIIIPSLNEAIIQQQTVTNESILDQVIKIVIIAITATTIYYFILKWTHGWSRA